MIRGPAEVSTEQRNRFEFLIVLFQLLPATLLSFFAVAEEEIASFSLIAVGTILKDVALVGLIFYLLWRAKEPIRSLGLHLRRAEREIILGFVLFLPVSFLASVAAGLFAQLGLPEGPTSLPVLQPKTPFEIGLGLVMVAVVAVAEETIFRGYFLLRFADVSRLRSLAVLASAVFFGLGHGYEGWTGVTAVTLMGAMLAGIYLWRGSLVAPIVIHFMQNFMAMILVPSMTGTG